MSDALAREALNRNVFDPDDWRRLDWADAWDDEQTAQALEPFGLSPDEPVSALELFAHFDPDYWLTGDWRTRSVASKLLFGIPTIAAHLALLSEEPELVARAAPVVTRMVDVMLACGDRYDRGENFNRAVVLGLHLLAMRTDE